jgi:hypothetical protein
VQTYATPITRHRYAEKIPALTQSLQGFASLPSKLFVFRVFFQQAQWGCSRDEAETHVCGSERKLWLVESQVRNSEYAIGADIFRMVCAADILLFHMFWHDTKPYSTQTDLIFFMKLLLN